MKLLSVAFATDSHLKCVLLSNALHELSESNDFLYFHTIKASFNFSVLDLFVCLVNGKMLLIETILSSTNYVLGIVPNVQHSALISHK